MCVYIYTNIIHNFWFLDSVTSKIDREIDMTLGLIKRSILTKAMLNPRTPEFGEAERSFCQ